MIREWMQQNQSVVLSALKVVGVIGLVGTALVALGVSGSAMALVFGGIASIVSAVGTVIGILGSVIGALISPIGLAIAGIGALAAISVMSWKSIQAAWSEGVSVLKEMWNGFVSTIGSGMGAMANWASQAWGIVQAT